MINLKDYKFIGIFLLLGIIIFLALQLTKSYTILYNGLISILFAIAISSVSNKK